MKRLMLQIAEGWRNHLSPKNKEAMFIAEVSRQRMCICKCCAHHSKHHTFARQGEGGKVKLRQWLLKWLWSYCTECGCPLISKTKCLSCECPIGKWWAVNIESYGEEKR